MPYDFKSIESKWQRIWEQTKLFKAPDIPKKKFYCLEMFAYPSGDIHMGHFRNYVIGDVVARFKMMQGYEVLHPFGWDAFGLPAEQAAIQKKIHPKEWTVKNIEVSRNTLKKVGLSYDWDREVITCNPEYYRWNQWVFLKLYEKNLAYRAKARVNWCPSCNTVLANEQVENGSCWRCGTEVTKRELEQWYFRITAYADRLLEGLDTLPGWPENLKAIQRNWIGRSEGAEVDFTLEGTGHRLPVYTTRPDTIYGVTFMSIAPEHPLLKELQIPDGHRKQVEQFVSRALKKTEIERTSTAGEKEGVFTGVYAVNPLSREKVQLWVADYVLGSYGTGIVMGVPAHDQRDFLFAKKYSLPAKVVIQPQGQKPDAERMEQAYEETGTMVNSGQFDGMPSAEGIGAVIARLEQDKTGRRQIHYRLRDWLISRQRYWGTPIPMIHCGRCGTVPVPEKDLPVILPENVADFLPKGRSPLEDVPEFINVSCPKCSGKAKRDPDTMDTFVDSSWYQLRYVDNKNSTQIFDTNRATAWTPVDKYIGGITHATGHLIYFRFFCKFFRDIGLVLTDEPALEMFNHGMVMDAKGEVMSKSKGNVVSPMPLIEKWGVDVSRLAMLFAAPPGKEMPWTEDGLTGTNRFLLRYFRLVEQAPKGGVDLKYYFKLTDLNDTEATCYRKLNWAIKKASDETHTLEFNTVVAALMELLNEVVALEGSSSRLYAYTLAKMAQLLAPYAPHVAEEAWQTLGFQGSVFKSSWPEFDPQAIKNEVVTYAVQVNGKLRATFEAPVNLPQEELQKRARSQEKVQAQLKDKKIVKTIVVPNKLVNIVVK